MNSTTLSPSFLQAALLVTGFKGKKMAAIQCALLTLGLSRNTFTAADLDEALLEGSRTISGCAAGSLVSLGLLEACGRVKSPREAAHGRKVDLFRVPDGKRGTVLSFLKIHGFALPAEGQQEFTLMAS